MSPSSVRMEVAGSSEVVSVASSAEPEEPGLIQDLWRRVSRYGRRAQEGQIVAREESGDLQGMLNEVSGQVPHEGPPDEEPPSSSESGVQRCGVCERSFRDRGPTATCPGCTKRVHKHYCVRYTRLSENLQAGMCNVCCVKVEAGIWDVEDYSTAQGVTWNREA